MKFIKISHYSLKLYVFFLTIMKNFMGVKTGKCSSHTWVFIAWSEISLNTQIKVFVSIYPTEKSLKSNPVSGHNERISEKADIT